VRVIVVGAGLAGLLAGRTLADAGHEVTLLDKGRSPGGRLATRRIGAATLDHGAQFFTVRSEAFAAFVQGWQAEGLVYEWCRGFTSSGDGFPRYAVHGGMNALAKRVAAGLDVRCGTLVFAIRPGVGGWAVGLDDATVVPADAVIVTCPLPQTASLLITAEVSLPERLRRVDYDRTLALLAVLDRPPGLAPPGGVPSPDATFSFLADNQAKGVSAVPAMTFHAAPDLSGDWWDRPPEEAHAELLVRARPWLGRAEVVESQLKRWRFATPREIWPHPCHVVEDADVPLILAGDAFAGPRVEGAALSGLAAARALLD
jgi:predicted NAD/FAD-dependent oxidoreductase